MLERILPAVSWIRDYRRGDLTVDMSAGLTVAIMLVPQSMAYAMLAGLPPVIGLYASTIPLLVYALFGSSRQLAVGPVAMISLLVYTGCSKLAEPGSSEYIAMVLLLALMVGAIQFLMGVFRMGFLVNFLSHAVIGGFTSAAAIIISLSQLKHLLGIELDAQHSVIHLIYESARRITDANAVTVAIGLTSIVILLVLKWKVPRFPAPLLVVVAGTLAAYFLHLEKAGVAIVGAVPGGMPGFSIPVVSTNSMGLLLPAALTIIFVGYMESISVSKFIAARKKYRIDANIELRALGLANTAASFFSGYPVTGGFSRTAVNFHAGARTNLSSVVTAVLIILTLLFFTPLFYYLPNAVLASVIVVAVLSLIDLEGARHLFRVKRTDGWTFVITLLVTLFVGVQQGIVVGVVFSLLIFVRRSAHPHIAELGYVERENVFHDIARYPNAKTYPHVLLFRVDASLYFANMAFLENHLRKMVEKKPDLRCVVLDLSGVNDIDVVAIDTLERLMEDYRERDIKFLFAGMKGPVRDLAENAGWKGKYGNRVTYPSLQHALDEMNLPHRGDCNSSCE